MSCITLVASGLPEAVGFICPHSKQFGIPAQHNDTLYSQLVQFHSMYDFIATLLQPNHLSDNRVRSLEGGKIQKCDLPTGEWGALVAC